MRDRFGVLPASLAEHINRASGLREHRHPAVASSACTRGAPQVPFDSAWIAAIRTVTSTSSAGTLRDLASAVGVVGGSGDFKQLTRTLGRRVVGGGGGDHRQVINAILWKLRTGAPWP